MPKRCGDLAGFTYKVTSELIGKYATTIVSRKKKFNFTAVHTEKLTREEQKKVKWPDLQIEGQPDGTFYGGRQVDYKGLNKLTYEQKFEHQEFGLSIYQGKNMKKTETPLKIEAYPAAGPEHKSVGIPMPTEVWAEVAVFDAATGTSSNVRRRTWNGSATAYQAGQNCGNFDIEFKDGVVTVTVKIKLVAATGSRAEVSGRIFKDVKQKVELFWNSRSVGYMQWFYHRKDCKRGEKCHCSVIANAKGEIIQAGCCKVPVRVKVEKGNDNPVNVTFLTIAQQQQLSTQGYVDNLRANTLNFYYPENNPNTFAHEVGHMMGFPDQYWYGVIAGGSLNAQGQPVPGGSFPIDDSSIMGQTMQKAKTVHIGADWLKSWINANVDSMEPINS